MKKWDIGDYFSHDCDIFVIEDKQTSIISHDYRDHKYAELPYRCDSINHNMTVYYSEEFIQTVDELSEEESLKYRLER